jgi:hypothetical protein
MKTLKRTEGVGRKSLSFQARWSWSSCPSRGCHFPNYLALNFSLGFVTQLQNIEIMGPHWLVVRLPVRVVTVLNRPLEGLGVG